MIKTINVRNVKHPWTELPENRSLNKFHTIESRCTINFPAMSSDQILWSRERAQKKTYHEKKLGICMLLLQFPNMQHCAMSPYMQHNKPRHICPLLVHHITQANMNMYWIVMRAGYSKKLGLLNKHYKLKESFSRRRIEL